MEHRDPEVSPVQREILEGEVDAKRGSVGGEEAFDGGEICKGGCWFQREF